MALTLEQLEDKLNILEGKNKVLERLSQRHGNPFEDLTIQLALESGATVSARTRYIWRLPDDFGIETGTPTLVSVGGWAVGLRVWSFAGSGLNGVTTSFAVPADWGSGTVKFTVFYQGAGGNTGNRVIAAHSAALTVGVDSFTRATEVSDSDAVGHGNTTLSSHTFATGETVTDGDLVRLAFSRNADSGADVNSDAMYMVGVRADYTAFF